MNRAERIEAQITEMENALAQMKTAVFELKRAAGERTSVFRTRTVVEADIAAQDTSDAFGQLAGALEKAGFRPVKGMGCERVSAEPEGLPGSETDEELYGEFEKWLEETYAPGAYRASVKDWMFAGWKGARRR